MMEILPKDILSYLCLRLEYGDIKSLSEVFKKIDNICSNNLFWMQKINYDFGINVIKENLEKYYLEIDLKVNIYINYFENMSCYTLFENFIEEKDFNIIKAFLFKKIKNRETSILLLHYYFDLNDSFSSKEKIVLGVIFFDIIIPELSENYQGVKFWKIANDKLKSFSENFEEMKTVYENRKSFYEKCLNKYCK